MRSGYPYIFRYAGYLINFLLISSCGLGSNSDSLRVAGLEHTADSLSAIRSFTDASLTYEKAIYFDSDPIRKARISLKRAQALKQIGSFNIAEQTLNRVDLNALSDSLFCEIKYNAALCAYLAGNFNSAESHIIQLNYFGRDSSDKTKYQPLYALVLNELARYADSKNAFDKYLASAYNVADTSHARSRSELNSLYTKQPKLKKVKKAALLSRFVPGLGQIYVGYWGEGITAMTCNVVFLGLTGVGIYYKYYVTSILYSSSVFAKFYLGNLTRAEYLANKRNYKLTKEYNLALKSRILDCWK